MDIRRIKQVCKYGWKDALSLSQEEKAHKGRIVIFFDILYCFLKYNVWSNQYKREKLHLVNSEHKKEICKKYQVENNKRDNWVKEFFDNYRFLIKWSSFKYERSATLQSKRIEAYRKYYGLSDDCFVGHSVIFHRHHYSDGRIVVGENCHISEYVDIDITGGINIGNGVSLAEGVKIFTHGHDYIGMMKSKCIPGTNAFITPLMIEDGVLVGAHSIILPDVRTIGKNSIISAGSVVKHSVPENVYMAGNPAVVVAKFPEKLRKHN